MTQFFYYGSGDLGAQAVRLGNGFRLTEAAEAGVVAMSQVAVDDPGGAVTIVGLKAFRVIETDDTAWPTLFRGYMADRNYGRADSLRTGAARRIDTTVTDLNAALSFKVLQGAAANRPAETDAARIAWWLSTAYTGGITDAGYIDSSGAVDLDACDYRGRFGADLMADCATTSGKNYFVTWDESTRALALHYYGAASSLWASTVKISNVLADVDGLTVFAPSSDAKLARDPSRVYSGVYLEYGDGTAAVYESDAGTASTFAPRDTSTVDTTVSTATKASAKANQLLAQAATEYDRISCTLQKVPSSVVNQLRVGHKVQVKFSHLPGYTSYTNIRVARRTVYNPDAQGLYSIDLELANTKAIRGKGGKPPVPNPDGSTDLVATSSLTLTRKEASRTTYTPLTWSYGVVASPRVQSTVSPNTPYTTCGCPLGAGGWGPGTSDKAIFWEYTPTLAASTVGAIFTTEVPTELLGQADTGYAYAVVQYHEPAFWGDWIPVGYFRLSTIAELYIARGLLRDGTTNWFGIVPGWQANLDAFFCAQDLIDGAGGPVVGGEGNSGRTNSFQVTATLCTLEGVGLGVWVAGIGLVDGDNQDFSLLGWTGVGAVQLLINGVRQPDDAYTIDRTTLVATMEAPPLEGDVVLWRYRVAL